ncbi:MAG: PAS domain S-box protein, partial [Nitrospinae bacterium]|nr:PAS domain S-box protein [Nitrospinota bacterium]
MFGVAGQKVKKPAFLNTPLGILITLSCAILSGEFLIMVLIGAYGALFKNEVSPLFWEFFDPFVLTILVSPVIYLLIFRPMRAQLDDLRRFQKSAVERELRIKELVDKIAALRNPRSSEQTGGIPSTSGSPEKPLHAAERDAAVQPTEESQRVALMFMLEELRDSRQKVEQAHLEWMAALDVMEDPIFLHDKQFRVLRCNKAYQQHAGVPFKEIIGRPYYEVFPKTHSPLSCCLRVMEKAEAAAEEEEIVIGDATYRSRAFAVKGAQGDHICSVHTFEDVTASRRVEGALLNSEEKFRKIGESAQDAIIMMGADQRISFWNAAAERIFGYFAAEATGRELHTLIVPAPARAGFMQAFPHFLAGGEGPLVGKITEVAALRKNGEEFPAELSISATQFGGQWNAVGVVRDVTERKRAEAKLRESEVRYRQIIQTSMDGICIVDAKGRFLEANDAYCQLIGYSREELLSMRVPDLEAKETPEETAQHIREIMTKGHVRFETRHRRKDGRLLDIEASVVHQPDKEDGHLFAFLRDVTERKRAENSLRHLNRALKTLGTVNHALVYATSEDVLLHTVCHAISEDGYELAWVGYVQHDADKTIKVMAHAGKESECLKTLDVTWADTERGQSPCGQAVRGGVTVLCQTIQSDPAYCVTWRDEALKYGYASIISLPLMNEGGVFGVLCVYSAAIDAFTVGETSLLEEMAADLAFGVTMLRLRVERDRAMKQSESYLGGLRDSLEDTVRAIALTVEMRDPYTAGHQRRVADLARAIATQLGLPAEQVHGLHLAGVVHDLGKINIPSEILSKPGKISEMEFGLIKTHPQAGYDILKDINFPWPISQMVLQHHERLDGSGYPQGLKDGSILLEARILCVADVIEAMSSHRPYRPGLGIDVALV